MAKRKQDDSILDSLLVMTVVAILWKREFWIPIVMISAAIILLYIYVNVKKRKERKQSKIYDIDKMNGHQFEEYLGILFRELGYQTQVTKASGDFGADLILRKNNKKIIVQAKRYKKNVGISSVQEIVGAKEFYKANQTWVVTNSNFIAVARRSIKEKLKQPCKYKMLVKSTLVSVFLF
ncbi:restriction endonuclease [Bacillus sp. S10(2024)]|uniref:restriction endonuclease n=1 Tax=Bacillus sp. S10(2024) TaxID=3162886 RepID=UPI003D1935A8